MRALIRSCCVIGMGVTMYACGYGVMQTARTVPRGDYALAVGGGYLHNEMVAERGRTLGNIPVHLALRRGFTDELDAGVQLYMGSGLLADVKYNLMQRAAPLALSLQGGFGGAAKPSQDHKAVLHVPLRILASYDLGSLATYGGVGYGTFWVLGYKHREAGVRYAKRRGHGDGVLMCTAGLAVSSGSVAFHLEYDFWTQVLDDPGDFYSFKNNHFFVGGLVF